MLKFNYYIHKMRRTRVFSGVKTSDLAICTLNLTRLVLSKRYKFAHDGGRGKGEGRTSPPQPQPQPARQPNHTCKLMEHEAAKPLRYKPIDAVEKSKNFEIWIDINFWNAKVRYAMFYLNVRFQLLHNFYRLKLCIALLTYLQSCKVESVLVSLRMTFRKNRKNRTRYD